MSLLGNPFTAFGDIANIFKENKDKKKAQLIIDLRDKNSKAFKKAFTKASLLKKRTGEPIPDWMLDVLVSEEKEQIVVAQKKQVEKQERIDRAIQADALAKKKEALAFAEAMAKAQQEHSPQPQKEYKPKPKQAYNPQPQKVEDTRPQPKKIPENMRIPFRGEKKRMKVCKDAYTEVSSRFAIERVVSGHRLDYFFLEANTSIRRTLTKAKKDIEWEIGNQILKKDYLPVGSLQSPQRDVNVVVSKFDTVIIVEKYKPTPMYWESYADLTEKNSAQFVLEVDGKPVVFDLAKFPHLFIAGTTGSGKSVAMNSIISYLNKNGGNSFHFISPKIDDNGGDLMKFNNISPVTHGAMKSDLEFLEEVQTVVSLVLEKMKTNEIKNLNGEEVSIRTFLVIDEVYDILLPSFKSVDKDLKTISKSVVSMLAEIARKGRSAKVHLILVTQKPDSDIVGQFKANTIMMALRVETDGDNATVGFRDKDLKATDLLGQGDGMIRFNGRRYRFQSPM